MPDPKKTNGNRRGRYEYEKVICGTAQQKRRGYFDQRRAAVACWPLARFDQRICANANIYTV
jgi:hypothetical protein